MSKRTKPFLAGLFSLLLLGGATTAAAQCHAPHCWDRYQQCLDDPNTTPAGCEGIFDRCLAQSCS